MKILFPALFLFTLLLLLGGCGGDDDPQPQSNAPPPRTGSVPASLPALTMPEIKSPWPPEAKASEQLSLEDKLTRKNYLLIFDGSGSMADSRCGGGRPKCDAAREAVIKWSAALPADTNLGLIVFDEAGFSTRLPLGRKNREAFVAQVQKIRPNYKTPLTKSLVTAYELLSIQGRRQLGYGEYHIVIVTDGIANSPEQLSQAVDAILRGTPIMIHTIGFCINGTNSLNQTGRTVYKAADNPQELQRGLDDVLAEAPSFDLTDF